MHLELRPRRPTRQQLSRLTLHFLVVQCAPFQPASAGRTVAYMSHTEITRQTEFHQFAPSARSSTAGSHSSA